MIRNKKQCIYCEREISISNFSKHYNSCKNRTQKQRENKSSFQIDEDWLREDGKYQCPNCDKKFSKNGMISHFWRKHIDEGKEFLKKQHPTLGKEAWNKGLTKETDERIASYTVTRNKRIESGEINTSFFSKKHSEETKRNLSNKRKEYLKNNKNKHNWSLYNGEETKPEKRFREILETIDNIQFFQYYIPNESNRFYEMDFAIPSLKIDFEVNGEQHYNRDGTLTDYYQERHDYFTTLGWTVIEIHYSLCFNDEAVKEIILKTVDKNYSFVNNICNKAINHRNIRKIIREEKELKRKNEVITKKINSIQNEFNRFYLIVDIIKEFENSLGLINELSGVLKVSHTQVRRILKKYDLDIKLRKDRTK